MTTPPLTWKATATGRDLFSGPTRMGCVKQWPRTRKWVYGEDYGPGRVRDHFSSVLYPSQQEAEAALLYVTKQRLKVRQ